MRKPTPRILACSYSMTAPELSEILPSTPGLRSRISLDSPLTAVTIVSTLLDDPPPTKAPVCEASVPLPRSGSVWVATFTSPNGGQTWKSTGSTDHDQALVLAKCWETEARAQRSKLGRPARPPILRVRPEQSGTAGSGLLTDDQGQQLCQQAGFKIPVAITATAWAKTVEAVGTWKPDDDGETLELKGGQSLTGRLWDLLHMLKGACGWAGSTDRVHFQVLVDVAGDGQHELVKLWAQCGPGDDARPVIAIMLEGED